MRNNETCTVLKCLKLSGLIEWVNLRLCKIWVYFKRANFLTTEARSLTKFKYCMCFFVSTITLSHDDNFGPDTLFLSGVVHLERVSQSPRLPLAESSKPKINDICETPSNIAL